MLAYKHVLQISREEVGINNRHERSSIMKAELVKIEHLVKQYDGGDVILNDLSLTIHEGEVVVVVGPSGCGKSTLLRCINALEPIQGGSISYRGEKIDARSKRITELRQKIGMVFQSYELFPHKTILQNVTLAPMLVQKRAKADAEKEALELLERVGLKDKRDNYPRQLSGGQKQRVAIARAMIMQPKLLLADEPTGALDSTSGKQLMELFDQLNVRGVTIVMITHDSEIASRAKKVYLIRDGRLSQSESVYEE